MHVKRKLGQFIDNIDASRIFCKSASESARHLKIAALTGCRKRRTTKVLAKTDLHFPKKNKQILVV